jgi:hypothetical protein
LACCAAGPEQVADAATVAGCCLAPDALGAVSLLASESLCLLRDLLGSPAWAAATARALESALGDLGVALGVQGGGIGQSLGADALLEGIGAVCALGGHSESVQTGACVGMAHTEATATVVSVDEAGALAHVVVTASGQSHEKLVRVNAEELTLAAHHAQMPTAARRLAAALVARHVAPLLGALLASLNNDAPIVSSQRPAVAWEPQSVFHAQLTARCVRVVEQPWLCAVWADSAKEHRPGAAFLRQLVGLATCVDDSGGGRFGTLADAESRALAARRRLYQLHSHSTGDPGGLVAAREALEAAAATRPSERPARRRGKQRTRSARVNGLPFGVVRGGPAGERQRRGEREHVDR